VIGAAAAALLVLLVLILVPLRFARAVGRAWRDPQFRGLFVIVIVTLAAGTLFYRQIEGWTFLDSFYFSSITLATVGYGDLAPQTDAGKLFTVFYVFTGVGLILGFLNAVAKAAVQQRAERTSPRNRRPKER
jgi:voltage-gated potassium channel Kch